MKDLFIKNYKYTRKDVRAILNISNPDDIGGIWSTGYIKHNNCFYIFANISDSGRTGHDYQNNLDGHFLYWYIKRSHNFTSNTVVDLMSGAFPIRIFCRYDSSNSYFTFLGYGKLADYGTDNDNWICWELIDTHGKKDLVTEFSNRKKFIEGSRTTHTVNRYERDPKARLECLKYHGYFCKVCNFDFETFYGSIGKNFIHVHHLIEMSRIGQEYVVDPINDLIPVCPNCHAMLHKRKPAYSINELKSIVSDRREKNEQ